jgi:hypothetical protein
MRGTYRIGLDVGMAPEHITEDPITVRTGERYLVAVAIHGFFLSKLATVSKVRRKAQEEGFRDVVVTEGSPPPGNPPTVGADYFVVGTFSGADRGFGRSQADGDVRIVDAWRLSKPSPPLGPPPPPPPPPDRTVGRNSDWILFEIARASINEPPGGDPAIAQMRQDLANARRVENEPNPPADLTLVEILNAQKRDAPPEYVKMLEDKFNRAMNALPASSRTMALRRRYILEMRRRAAEKATEKRIVAQEGAKLGHLRFGATPGVSFGIAKTTAPPQIGLGEEIEDRLFGATMRRLGAAALVTSPFWLLVLLAPRSPR